MITKDNKPMQKNLTVLSFNMFGTPFHPKRIVRSFLHNNVRKRFKAASQEINTLDADVLFLQEVIDFPHFIYLKKLLPDFRYVCFKNTIYGPRGGLVIFSKLPLERSYYHDFLERGNVHNKSITGLLSLKGILATKIKGSNLILINTHLNQNSDHDWSITNRYTPILESQLKQLAVYTWSITERGEKLILAGDFNMPKNTHFYKNFLRDTGLTDAFSKDSFSTKYPSESVKGTHIDRIDYIFASPSLKLNNHSYRFTKPAQDSGGKSFLISDHIGLLASFRVE